MLYFIFLQVGIISSMSFEDRIVIGTYSGIFLFALIVWLVFKKSGLEKKIQNATYKSISEKMGHTGRWISEEEYNRMVSKKLIKKIGDYNVYEGKPIDIEIFEKEQKEGTIYVEFRKLQVDCK